MVTIYGLKNFSSKALVVNVTPHEANGAVPGFHDATLTVLISLEQTVPRAIAIM